MHYNVYKYGIIVYVLYVLCLLQHHRANVESTLLFGGLLCVELLPQSASLVWYIYSRQPIIIATMKHTLYLIEVSLELNLLGEKGEEK